MRIEIGAVSLQATGLWGLPANCISTERGPGQMFPGTVRESTVLPTHRFQISINETVPFHFRSQVLFDAVLQEP